MRTIKRILIGVIVAIALFTLTGFFAAPPILKSLLTKQLSATLHRNASIGTISLNPYTMRLKVQGFVIQEKGGTLPFISFEELHVKVAAMPLFKKVLFLKELRITKPYVKIDRKTDNSFNFSDLLKVMEGPAHPPSKPPAKPFGFVMNGIRITDGRIDFLDELEETKHTVTDLNLAVPFLSSLPHDMNTGITPSLSLKINNTPYKIEGTTKPFADSLETAFNIDLRDLDIPYYLTYAPMELPFNLSSAYLDLVGKVSFTQYKNRAPDLVITGEVSLREFDLRDGKNGPVIAFPLLNLSIASLEPLARKVHFSRIIMESPQIHLKRTETGALSILSLIPAEKQPPPAPAPKSVKEDKKPEAPFTFNADLAEINKGKLLFQDLSVPGSPATKVENIQFKGENISLGKGERSKFLLSCLVNNKGTVVVDGTAGLSPLAAEAALSLKNMEIHPFQPYFTDMVRITVTGGALTAKGKATFSSSDTKGPSAAFTGTFSVDRFTSVDKRQAEDFLKWNSLYFSNLNFTYNPTTVSVSGISLTDFFARVTISPKGTLNIQEAFSRKGPRPQTPVPSGKEKEDKAETGSAKKGEEIPVKVGAVTLQGGLIIFKDESIKPSYSATLEEVGGRISGLSSQINTTADVDLRAKLDRYAPLEITGKINPLREDLFVDLKVRFRDMELSPTTPYAGKYIGYTVAKGKLSFELQYLINKKKLDSQNIIFIDQLTLGDSVESPEATKLPVRLAIALLKDRAGQIRLDVPVSGTLDDPQFSVWGIIVKVLVNLLSKAATAPFALLGSLFGGGEELGFAEFEYGSEAVTEESAKKIDSLTKALGQRPALRLDIEGYVDPEKDREGLQHLYFERKLKAQKLKSLLKTSAVSESLDNVKIAPQEYEEYLRLAYKAEKFPKPRDFIGLEKSLPVPEMEKLMLTNIVVKDDDLRLLAARRAGRTKDMILKDGTVDPGRVFVVEPKTVAPANKAALKKSRVEFRLK